MIMTMFLYITFGPFQPFTKYHVTIIPRVTGVVGNGPQSSVDVTTFQDRPFSPVRRLRTSDVASTSVHISWERPEKANGIIVGYSLASEIISKKVPGLQSVNRNHKLKAAK